MVDSGGQQSLMITCHPLALSMCVYFDTQIQTPFARKAWSDNQSAAYEEMSYAIVPKVGEDDEAFRMLVGKVSGGCPNGAYVYYDPVVCLARKK